MEKTVIAVLPSASDLNLLEESLRGEGVDIQVACSGEEAVMLLAANDASVVLYDADNGQPWRDALRRIKNAWPSARVVLSSSADRRMWMDLFALGGFDMLFKPFNAADVRSTIRSALHPSPFTSPRFGHAA